MRGDSPVLGTIRTFMDASKSYIQYWGEESGTWHSVVNLSKGRCRNRHKEFCREIFARCLEPGFGLVQAENLKKQLIAS